MTAWTPSRCFDPVEVVADPGGQGGRRETAGALEVEHRQQVALLPAVAVSTKWSASAAPSPGGASGWAK